MVIRIEIIERYAGNRPKEGYFMQGYFDIHSHILPGVDDGAMDMEETRRMLFLAQQEGIRIIVATPHYTAGRSKYSAEHFRAVYEEVSRLIEEAAGGLQVILGSELFYNMEMLEDLKKGLALTIDNTRYILVEFHPSDSFHHIRVGLYQCIFGGYIPILAHAERYQCLVKNPHLIYELIKLGVYIQLNLTSITGTILDPKVRYCHHLLKNGWVHFLGTDAHGAFERVPCIGEAVNIIQKRYGEKMVRTLLWDNPMTMLEDRHI